MRTTIPMFLALALAGGGCVPDGSNGGADAGPPASCEKPLEVCGASCVNKRTDPTNCGDCGHSCPPSSFCSEASCVAICSSGLTACGASCVDKKTDRAHCGDCGHTCPTDQDCKNGECRCPDGYRDCHGRCVNADGDHENCGLCDHACKANEICNHGSCDCAGGTRETDCGDHEDNDCDDLVDCADPDCAGSTRACMGACGQGTETCLPNGTYGPCEGGNGETEICGDGIDQDCNGSDLRNPDAWEPNDTCETCAMIQGTNPNVFLRARFDSVDDQVDCYKFAVTDGAYYPEHILVDLDMVPAGHDYDLYLYANLADCQSRTPLAASEASGNASESIDWSESFGTSDDGTYYVRVVRFAGHSCTDDYRLTINGLR